MVNEESLHVEYRIDSRASDKQVTSVASNHITERAVNWLRKETSEGDTHRTTIDVTNYDSNKVKKISINEIIWVGVRSTAIHNTYKVGL